jgi:hypothetical protein
MSASRRLSLAIGLACLPVVITPAAFAAPITVNLRVEGATQTLFEGSVTTEGEMFETPSTKGVPHPCNYSENGASGGEFTNGGSPSGTPTTALRDAALATGLSFDAEWFGTGASNGNPGDFFITRVGPDINQTVSPFASWGYAVNETTAPVGGCQIALAPGSEVLWAYNYFGLSHHLTLSGPTSVSTGAPFTIHVADAQTDAPIAGASIGDESGGVTTPLPGNPTTDAKGNATVALANAGAALLKATQPESVRSPGLDVCVHAGNDGTCGTSTTVVIGPHTVVNVPTTLSGTSSSAGASGGSSSAIARSARARIAGIKNGHVYSRARAPRVLRGVVHVGAGGTLRDVRIRLQRRHDGRCFDFSGSREAFVRSKRCRAARFFSVGGSESFSYLLPAPLPPGKYRFDIEAVEASGRRTVLVNGVSHVVFRVA